MIYFSAFSNPTSKAETTTNALLWRSHNYLKSKGTGNREQKRKTGNELSRES